MGCLKLSQLSALLRDAKRVVRGADVGHLVALVGRQPAFRHSASSPPRRLPGVGILQEVLREVLEREVLLVLRVAVREVLARDVLREVLLVLRSAVLRRRCGCPRRVRGRDRRDEGPGRNRAPFLFRRNVEAGMLLPDVEAETRDQRRPLPPTETACVRARESGRSFISSPLWTP